MIYDILRNDYDIPRKEVELWKGKAKNFRKNIKAELTLRTLSIVEQSGCPTTVDILNHF